MKSTKVLQAIYNAINELDQELQAPLEKSPQTILFGKGSQLDSLGLVRLIVMTEQQVEDKNFKLDIKQLFQKA